MKAITDEEARSIAQKLYRYNTLPPYRIPNLDSLDDQAVLFYKEHGYLVIDQLIDISEVAAALAALTDIIHGRISGPYIQWSKKKDSIPAEQLEDSVRKINDYAEFSPALKAIVNNDGMLRALDKLFGEKPLNILNQALLKPPFGGAEKPWHQDMAYGNQNYDKQTATIWIALDEATTDNGCMHVIPRSHLKGGVPHYMVRDWQVCDRDVDVDKDVVVPLKPGGALLFSGLLLHGTPANFSEKRRRALQLRFTPESAHKMSKDTYKLMFTNELIDVDC